MLRTRFLIITILVLILISIPAVALAQETDVTGDEVPTLVEVLTMLAGGGGLGAIVSFLAEQSKLFQGLAAAQKKATVLAINLGLPILATALLQFVPPDLWAAIDPYWKALAVGFTGWVTSQGVYIVQKVATKFTR